ncbi:pyridoxal 5'-phosphate synthase [Aeromonas popoffii]|uniref:pyridoxal 5'-phosphate synthase n=1 Tax=Aeromonas popoffii TaxID=70856 RepID=UPI0009FC1022
MSSKFESLSGRTDLDFPAYESTVGIKPLGLAQSWLNEAQAYGVREPRAMVLATVNAAGQLSSRVMAILECNDEGIVFATHDDSRKIRDVAEAGGACGHFYWRELGRQLSVSGTVRALPRELAEAAWQLRPIPLHSMSTVSRQSAPLLDPEALRAADQAAAKKGALPCPASFAVYMLEPQALEFWAASPHRLHRRLRFERQGTAWSYQRLQP